MRGALHLLCTMVLLPYLMLAGWFLILGDAISGGSLTSFFTTLLAHALWLVPWGLLGFAAAMFGIMALGLIDGVRWLGAICLFILAAGCLLVVIGMDVSAIDLGALLFLLPCFAVAFFGAWLAIAELRERPRHDAPV